MKEKLEELLNEVIITVKEAKSFSKENAPEYAKELLTFETYSCYWYLAVALAFSGVGTTGIVCGIMYNSVDWMKWVGGGLILVSFFCSVDVISTLIQVKFAPKVYIVEYLRKMIR